MIVLVRNDRDAALGIGPGPVAIAGLAALVTPVVLGAFLFVYDWMVLRQGGAATAMTGLAAMLALSPIVSWAAVAPLALWSVALARRGWGGLMPVVASGLVAGFASGLALAPAPEAVALASGLGALLAAVFWLVLARRAGGALAPRRG